MQEKKQKKCEFLLFAYLVSFGFVFAIFVKRHAKSDDTGEDCKKDNYVYHWGCVVHVKRGGIGAGDGKYITDKNYIRTYASYHSKQNRLQKYKKRSTYAIYVCTY